MLSTFRNLRRADRLLRQQEGGGGSSQDSHSSSEGEGEGDSGSGSVEDVDSQPDSVDLEDYRDRLR